MSAPEGARPGWGLPVKLFAAMSVAVLSVAAVAVVATTVVLRSSERRGDARRLADVTTSLLTTLAADSTRLLAGVRSAAGLPWLPDVILAGDVASIEERARAVATLLGAEYAAITDPRGVLLARSDRPGAAGDTLEGPLAAGAAAGREPTAGFTADGGGILRFGVAAAIRDTVGDSLLGVLVVAQRVTDPLASRLAAITGAQVVFYTRGAEGSPSVAAASGPRTPELAVAARAVAQRPIDSGGRRVEVVVDGVRHVAGHSRLVDAGGRDAGGVLLLLPRDPAIALATEVRTIIGVTAAAGLLLALVLSALTAGWIARPLQGLVAAARQVADGDLGSALPAAGRDAIGQLVRAFGHMQGALRETQRVVTFLHAGEADADGHPALPDGGEAAGPTMARSTPAAVGMLAPGQRFAGRYEIRGVLGAGVRGVVYRAWDDDRRASVALRAIRLEAVAEDPEVMRRLRDEIGRVRAIVHRNVVRIHDIGEVEGLFYIAMEPVEGRSLAHLVRRRGHLPPGVVVPLGKQLCSALDAAHRTGVLHRDLTPASLVVEPTGTLLVMDLGLSLLGARFDSAFAEGRVIGAPAYLAPEQLLGAEVDVRADVYSAGAVLYECLAGRPPFVADSPILLVSRKLEEAPSTLRGTRPGVPEALERAVLAALDRDPDRRPDTAMALHDLLDAVAV